MRSPAEIHQLLDELNARPAYNLEDQDLDFKEWTGRSAADAVDMVVEMAICMANGGGGTVVFGVNDKVVGRSQAVRGVPREVDINRLRKAVYDRTDPKLTPVFEELAVPEGAGRLLVMQIFPGLPPYTDTSGLGKIRVGKDCQPLTETLRRRVMVETGETEFTAVEVPGDPASHLSVAVMEQLRESARVCQRHESEVREILSVMEINAGYLERGGTGRGTYWTLRPDLHRRLSAPGHPERDRRISWEAAKTRVLSVLKQRAERRDVGLSNAEIRQVTHLDRHQVLRLMHELMREEPRIVPPSKGRYARYRWRCSGETVPGGTGWGRWARGRDVSFAGTLAAPGRIATSLPAGGGGAHAPSVTTAATQRRRGR